jgi:hypothetical protein
MKTLTNFAKKLFSYAQKYWKITALVALVVFSYIFFRRNKVDYDARIKGIQERHQEQIARIETARLEERERYEESERRLKIVLADIQKKYKDAMLELDKKKKQEIAVIVKTHGNDPVKMSEELSSLTGIKVKLPEEF